MWKKYLFSLFCICFTAIINAQTIKGTILTHFDDPVPFANVRIMENDTVLLAGTTADENGDFELLVPDKLDSINLVLTGFGYKRTTLSVLKSSLDSMKLFYIGEKFKTEDLAFSAKDAERDIKKGLIRFYVYGYPVIPPNIMRKIIKKNGYSYKLTYLSCNIDQNIIESVRQYNAYVRSYLEEKYGKDWGKGIESDMEDYLRKTNTSVPNQTE